MNMRVEVEDLVDLRSSDETGERRRGTYEDERAPEPDPLFAIHERPFPRQTRLAVLRPEESEGDEQAAYTPVVQGAVA